MYNVHVVYVCATVYGAIIGARTRPNKRIRTARRHSQRTLSDASSDASQKYRPRDSPVLRSLCHMRGGFPVRHLYFFFSAFPLTGIVFAHTWACSGMYEHGLRAPDRSGRHHISL